MWRLRGRSEAGLGRAVRGAVSVGSALLMSTLAGCEACDYPQSTYVVTDAQIAMLTEGTGSVTAAGCQIVCWNHVNNLDAGAFDAGPPPDFADASGRSEDGYLHCSLAAHRLTCTWPRRCAR